MDINKNIQGLRAVAVVLVVASHTGWSILSGGFVGVDVFFVLSGFLITGILHRQHLNTGTVSFLSFLTRRARRLLPLLVVVVFTVVLCSKVLLSTYEALQLTRSAPYAVSWTSNIYFALTSFDYFDELSKNDLFLHTWSLAVEEQFYLLWPWLIFIILKVNGKIRRNYLQPNHSLGIVMLLLSCFAFSGSFVWTNFQPLHAFYQMPSRVWQFALGGLAYFLIAEKSESKIPVIGNMPSTLIGLIGVLLILGSGITYTSSMTYPGWRALSPSLGAFIVLLVYGGNRTTKSWLAFGPLVWIGDRSYSIYLWHWPILMIGFALGYKEDMTLVIALLLGTLVISDVSYRVIEVPFWKGTYSRTADNVSILMALIIIIVLSFAYQGWSKSERLSDKSSGILMGIKTDISPAYKLGCDSWYYSSDVQPCVFGSESAEKTAILVGDSIGTQWFSAFSSTFPSPDWKFIVLTKSACAITSVDYYYKRIGELYSVCSEWRDSVVDEIKKLKPDVLIVGSAASYDFSPEQWVKGSKDVFRKFSSSAKQIIIVPGTPILNFDGPNCMVRNLEKETFNIRNLCSSRASVNSINVANYLAAAAADFDNIQILNLNDLVCPHHNCSAISKKGVAVFSDTQHLTDSFVVSQAATIKKRIQQSLGLSVELLKNEKISE